MTGRAAHVATARSRSVIIVRALLFCGVAVLGVILSPLASPYPNDACPAAYGSDCLTPSPRQRVWALVVAGALVGLLLIGERLLRRRSLRTRSAYLAPALAMTAVALWLFLPTL